MSDHKRHHSSAGSSKYGKLSSNSKSYSSMSSKYSNSSKQQGYNDDQYADDYYSGPPPKGSSTKEYKKRARSPLADDYYKEPSYNNKTVPKNSYKVKDNYHEPSDKFYYKVKSRDSVSPYGSKKSYGGYPDVVPPKAPVSYDSYSKQQSSSDWAAPSSSSKSNRKHSKYDSYDNGGTKHQPDQSYPAYDYYNDASYKVGSGGGYGEGSSNYDYNKGVNSGRGPHGTNKMTGPNQRGGNRYLSGGYNDDCYGAYSADKYSHPPPPLAGGGSYDHPPPPPQPPPPSNKYNDGGHSNYGNNSSSRQKSTTQLSRYVIGDSVVYGSPGHYPQGLLSRTPTPPPPPPKSRKRRHSPSPPHSRKAVGNYNRGGRCSMSPPPYNNRPVSPDDYKSGYGKKKPLYPSEYSPEPPPVKARHPRSPPPYNQSEGRPKFASDKSATGKKSSSSDLTRKKSYDGNYQEKADYGPPIGNRSKFSRSPSSKGRRSYSSKREKHNHIDEKVLKKDNSARKSRSLSNPRKSRSIDCKDDGKCDNSNSRKKPLLTTPPRPSLLGSKPPLLTSPPAMMQSNTPFVPSLMDINPTDGGYPPMMNSRGLDGRLGNSGRRTQYDNNQQRSSLSGRLGNRGGRDPSGRRMFNRRPDDLRGLLESRREQQQQQSNGRRQQSSNRVPQRFNSNHSVGNDGGRNVRQSNRNMADDGGARMRSAPGRGTRGGGGGGRSDRLPLQRKMAPRSFTHDRNNEGRPPLRKSDYNVREGVGANRSRNNDGGANRRGSPQGGGARGPGKVMRRNNIGGRDMNRRPPPIVANRSNILKKYQRLNVRKRATGAVGVSRLRATLTGRKTMLGGVRRNALGAARRTDAKGKVDRRQPLRKDANKVRRSSPSTAKYSRGRSPNHSNNKREGGSLSPRRSKYSRDRSRSGTPSANTAAGKVNSTQKKSSKDRSPSKTLSPSRSNKLNRSNRSLSTSPRRPSSKARQGKSRSISHERKFSRGRTPSISPARSPLRNRPNSPPRSSLKKTQSGNQNWSNTSPKKSYKSRSKNDSSRYSKFSRGRSRSTSPRVSSKSPRARSPLTPPQRWEGAGSHRRSRSRSYSPKNHRSPSLSPPARSPKIHSNKKRARTPLAKSPSTSISSSRSRSFSPRPDFKSSKQDKPWKGNRGRDSPSSSGRLFNRSKVSKSPVNSSRRRRRQLTRSPTTSPEHTNSPSLSP